MAIISKYPSEQVEQILQEVLTILDNHKAPTDLSLMVMGNAVTTLLNTRVSSAQRKALAQSFGKALISSIEEESKQS
ncbi:DUF1414 domain-containing protein [Celerinatantimonas sp. YJH-8]|uniref:DUF1414 domain-containing protein n=1 Tax=Celerinatantimonas sp. YJH-8 TaxID=3228714 RepID=UPI0038C33AAE